MENLFSIEDELWHLSSRINRKLLAHTVCRGLNHHHVNPLRFADLIS